MGNSSFMGNKRPMVTIQHVYQDKYDLSFGNITFPFQYDLGDLQWSNESHGHIDGHKHYNETIKHVSQIIC